MWGNTLEEVREAYYIEEQNLRFQGQYLDRETGLHFNTFRYYDLDVGRFTTPDPIGLSKIERTMDITNGIIPKVSIGGISIGESITEIEACLSTRYKTHKEPNSLTIDNGFIRAYHGADGIITAVSCNQTFTGRYQNKLWAGMTVEEVLKHSREQLAWSGFVQVDKISGIGLSLPEEHDDFESLTDNFALDFIFEELWVYDF